MRVRNFREFFALALAATSVSVGSAQAQEHPTLQRGFAPEKTFQSGDIDNVNLLNGNLVITIPIGHRYETQGGFSYGLTLHYNSNVWDFQESQTGGLTQVFPMRLGSNAGLGWTLSLGRVLAVTETLNTTSHWVYISPDGAQHTMYSSLHENEGTVAGVLYSRDGSYIRMRGATSSAINAQVQIDFPSGETHAFKHYAANDWRPITMADRYGNSVSVDYATPNQWRLTDGFLRTQVIKFQSGTNLASVVSSVELTGFPGAPAETYSFEYDEGNPGGTTIGMQCPAGDPGNRPYSLLTKITLPDGSSYRMARADYDLTAGVPVGTPPRPPCVATPGYLKKITLPTGGTIQYTYRGYQLVSAGIPNTCNGIKGGYLQSSQGVGTRTVASGQITGDWTYSPVLSDYAHSPGVCDFPREFVNTVRNPLGDKTVSYFSVFRDGQATNTEGWKSTEFGLPFTRFATDGTGWFLSSEVLDCDSAGSNCTTLRRNYVAYEQDKLLGIPDESSGDLYNLNSRASAQRRKDLDSTIGDDVSSEVYSRFDGFGHYRQIDYNDNFAGGASPKTVHTEYNPNSGTYPAGGVGSTFVQRASGDPWVLGTYSEQRTTDGSVTAAVKYCFSVDGFLLRKRTVKSLAGAVGATDLVARYSADALGNLTREEYFGGDGAALPTTELCGATLSGSQYEIRHNYTLTASDWIHTARYYDAGGNPLPFYSTDETVDVPSGLLRVSADTAGLTTAYTYGAMGRLTLVQPQQSGQTSYTYAVPTASSPTTTPSVTITRKSNDGTTDLAQSKVLFDGLGRVWQSQETRPGGSLATRETKYDKLGNRFTVSELGNTAKKTTFEFYDPFGRPGRVTSPDTKVTTLLNRKFWLNSKTQDVGTSFDGTNVLETPAETKEYHDRFGRLYQVTESSDPGGGAVDTNYDYDILDHLTRVRSSAGTQQRTFTYDFRGFLTSETHPEKTGSVTYTYDARGHVTRKVDGPNDLTFVYDRAERIDTIRKTGGAVLKKFDYSTANVGSDFSLGKLQKATRHNLFTLCNVNHDAAIEETYKYEGLQGAVSQRDTKLNYDNVYGESFSQSFTWTELGLPDKIFYPTCKSCTANATTLPGRTVRFNYTQGLLTSVDKVGSATPYASSITYHPSGLVATVVHGNGVTDAQTADPNGMARPRAISAVGATTLWSSGGDYKYDGAGNVTRAGAAYFFYDRVSRLREGQVFLGALGASGGAKTERLTYDSFGNMQTRSVQLGAQTPVVSDVTTDSTTNRLVAGSYDSAGDLKVWGNQNYTYDAFSQAIEVKIQGGEDWLYFYTADDERVWSYKLGGAPFNRWTIRGLGNEVLREFVSDNSGWHMERDYVHRGKLLLLAAETPNGVTHFHLDHLGTPRAISDSAGVRTSYHAYLPFGEEATAVSQDTERRKFTSHERDSGSGTQSADALDYMHARFRGTAFARFETPDTIPGDTSRPQSWNRYSYVLNNPLRAVDRTGLYEEDVHEGLTEALAEAAGFSSTQASTIAAADQGVDENPSTEPFSSKSARENYHFTTPERRDNLWSAFGGSSALGDLGVFLHAEQDSFSHDGFGPVKGHLFAGHAPDKTYNDVAKANTMAHDTFSRLVLAAVRVGASGKVVSWDKIAKLVDTFNRAKTPSEKTAALDKLRSGIRAMAK